MTAPRFLGIVYKMFRKVKVKRNNYFCCISGECVTKFVLLFYTKINLTEENTLRNRLLKCNNLSHGYWNFRKVLSFSCVFNDQLLWKFVFKRNLLTFYFSICFRLGISHFWKYILGEVKASIFKSSMKQVYLTYFELTTLIYGVYEKVIGM